MAASACSNARPQPQVASDPVDSQLVISVSGKVNAGVDTVTRLRVVKLGGPGYEEIALLSVGLEEPIRLEDGRMIRAAVDIVGFTGDATYQIGGSAETAEAGVRSAFFVEISTPGRPEAFRRFDRPAQPCVVEILDGGTGGDLRCPRLAGTGDSVQVGMTWSSVTKP